jgi:hypothetical protein
LSIVTPDDGLPKYILSQSIDLIFDT